jgi:hypothetical protein
METCEASGRLAMPIDSLEQVGIRRGHEGMPLMTALGLIGGDVLTYLDEHGVGRLDELSQRIDWPRWMTLMGVGALVRQGLVRAMRQTDGVTIEGRPERDNQRDAREAVRNRMRLKENEHVVGLLVDDGGVGHVLLNPQQGT